VLVLLGRRWIARELAVLVPNVVRLFAGLLRDPRVPLPGKIAIGLASLWIASPIDLIPEFIPVIGSVDDAIVAIVVVRFVLAFTSVDVLREHWHGDPRTFDRMLRLAGRADVPRALP
jgi:uncharacterized membrane protein YkvA (DUF1232 family)